jgi:hypothetical protein
MVFINYFSLIEKNFENKVYTNIYIRYEYENLIENKHIGAT